jgi:hypothetical protein
MSSFRLRPCFSHVLNFPVEEARDKIVRQVERDAAGCEVKSFPGFVCLRIPEADRHYWSPRLNLSLDAAGEGKTLVSGTYGPNVNMWASFLYGYLIVGSLGIFSLILGCCQWVLEMWPWGLWVFALMLALAVGMYLSAQFGQKLAAQQTFKLHRIYESAVGQEVEIH